MSAKLHPSLSGDDFMARMAEFNLGLDEPLDQLRDPPKLELKDPAKAAPKIRLPSFGPDDFGKLSSSFLRTESPLRSSSITGIQIRSPTRAESSDPYFSSITSPTKDRSYSSDSYSSITTSPRSSASRGVSQDPYLSSITSPKVSRNEGTPSVAAASDDSYLASILGGAGSDSGAADNDAPSECMCVKCKGKPSANPTHCDSPVNCMCYKCQKQRRRDVLRSGASLSAVDEAPSQQEHYERRRPPRSASENLSDHSSSHPPANRSHSTPTHQSYYQRVRDADRERDLTLLEDGDEVRLFEDEHDESLTEPIRRLRNLMEKHQEEEDADASFVLSSADDIRAGPTLRRNDSAAIATAANRAAQRLSLTSQLTPPDKLPEKNGKKLKVLTASYRTGGLHNHLTLYHTMKMKTKRERMNAYERAFKDCIHAQTGLWEWTKKQKEKGPPTAVTEYKANPKEFQPKRPLFRPAKSSPLANLGHKRRESKSDPGDDILPHNNSRDSLGASSMDSNEIAKSDKSAKRLSMPLSPVLGPSKLSSGFPFNEDESDHQKSGSKGTRDRTRSFRRAHTSPSTKPYAHIDQPLRPGTQRPTHHRNRSSDSYEKHNGSVSSLPPLSSLEEVPTQQGSNTANRSSMSLPEVILPFASDPKKEELMSMLDLLDWDNAAGPSPSNSSVKPGGGASSAPSSFGWAGKAETGANETASAALSPQSGTLTGNGLSSSPSESLFAKMAANVAPPINRALSLAGPMPEHTVSSIYGIRVAPVMIPEPKVVKVVPTSRFNSSVTVSYPPSPPSPTSSDNDNDVTPSLLLSPLMASRSVDGESNEAERTPLPSKRISTYRKPLVASRPSTPNPTEEDHAPSPAPVPTPSFKVVPSASGSTPSTPSLGPTPNRARAKSEAPPPSQPNADQSTQPISKIAALKAQLAPAPPPPPAPAPGTSKIAALKAQLNTAPPPKEVAPPSTSKIAAMVAGLSTPPLQPVRRPPINTSPSTSTIIQRKGSFVQVGSAPASPKLSPAEPATSTEATSPAPKTAVKIAPVEAAAKVAKDEAAAKVARNEAAAKLAKDKAAAKLAKDEAAAKLAKDEAAAKIARDGAAKIARDEAAAKLAKDKAAAKIARDEAAAKVAKDEAAAKVARDEAAAKLAKDEAAAKLARDEAAKIAKDEAAAKLAKDEAAAKSARDEAAAKVAKDEAAAKIARDEAAAKIAKDKAATKIAKDGAAALSKLTLNVTAETVSSPKLTPTTISPQAVASPKVTLQSTKLETVTSPKLSPKVAPKVATEAATPEDAALKSATSSRPAPKETVSEPAASTKQTLKETVSEIKNSPTSPRQGPLETILEGDGPTSRPPLKSSRQINGLSPSSSTASATTASQSIDALSPSSSTASTSTTGQSPRPASVSINASTSTSLRAQQAIRMPFEKGINDLCKLLPHVKRSVLKQYMDRAGGDYIAAIGLCMTDVKAGKL
ncbi:hypothetical protein BC937DRAFT_90611 [Endogone sp. FLAS-F59071]|nr:hypothetical protein BC937DRAFT_90611 [Endogone sp. FLAS-F59071]|eukprot:RUS16950.1 hypothetical protein BC937DRAFT_90611 [Endogone sp. FLAS-F59071]